PTVSSPPPLHAALPIFLRAGLRQPHAFARLLVLACLIQRRQRVDEQLDACELARRLHGLGQRALHAGDALLEGAIRIARARELRSEEHTSELQSRENLV